MSIQDQRHILSSISVQTLITHGLENALYAKENSEYLNKNIPNSKLVSFADYGHILHMEDYEKFNNELISFIG